MSANLIRRLQAAAAEHGTLDGAPPDRSLLLQEAADTLEADREVLRRTYERLSQDGYDYDGPTLARIREHLTGRRDQAEEVDR